MAILGFRGFKVRFFKYTCHIETMSCKFQFDIIFNSVHITVFLVQGQSPSKIDLSSPRRSHENLLF